jgi:putative oxidoreductase
MLKPSIRGFERRSDLNTIDLGLALQRLFSTFPNSWPGLGLLLLRSCLGITLIYFGIAGLAAKSSEPITFAQNLLTLAGSIFLFSGLWTPVIAGLVALEELWKVLGLHRLPGESALIHIVLAVLAVSLAMLGPGAWSIDARLFGRKRFDIDRTRGRKTPL